MTAATENMQVPSWSGLLEAVRRSARLGPADDPARAIRAALAALAERVPEGLSRTLVTRLPQEFAAHLRPSEPIKAGYADDLVAEVAEAANLDALRAASVARVVFGVVDRASSGALAKRAGTSLPEDVRDLVLSASRRRSGG